jgi:hypothetical protein
MKNISTTYRILLAIISGALIIPLSYLESFGEYSILGASIIDIMIGAVFALLVMIPFQKRIHWLKLLLMIIASIAIYVGVAHLAVTKYKPLYLEFSYDISIVLSGGLGALLTGLAVQILAPLQLTFKSYISLLIVGLISGYIFSHSIDSPNIFVNAIGFIIWQTLVCYAIVATKKHSSINNSIIKSS